MPITYVKTIGTVGIMGGLHSLPTPFVKSLVDMIQFNNEYLLGQNEQIYYDFADMSYHSMARNSLAKRMRGEWILMLDTDQTFEPDTLVRLKWLADSQEIDILTGLYFQKGGPFLPVIFKLNENNRFEHIRSWDKELIPIDSAGGGCLFIRNHILKRLFYQGALPFAEIEGFSEDHSFFKRLLGLGVKSFCATDVQVDHLAWQNITEENYNANH